VRAASLELWWGEVWPWGFDPFARIGAVDAGDAVQPNGVHDGFLDVARGFVDSLIAGGARPFGVGGDHATTLAPLRALAAVHGPLALLQFDAHADTGAANPLHHGSVIRAAAEEGLIDPSRTLQVGIRAAHATDLGIHVWDAESIALTGGDLRPAFRERLDSAIRGPAYVTLDIDVLDPAFAPGTGTPVPGGLSTAQLMAMLRCLTRIQIAGADVVEVAPDLEGATDTTALAAANGLLELVAACGSG